MKNVFLVVEFSLNYQRKILFPEVFQKTSLSISLARIESHDNTDLQRRMGKKSSAFFQPL